MFSKKIQCLGVVLIALLLCSPVFSAQDSMEYETKVSSVDFVDNANNRVVIGDMEYLLKLNTSVSDDKKRQLNRYALKVGQEVSIRSFYENKKTYLESIIILSK
jgi:hypothetical protein